jgi:hypothetical protein
MRLMFKRVWKGLRRLWRLWSMREEAEEGLRRLTDLRSLESTLRQVRYQPDSLFPLAGREPEPDALTPQEQVKALADLVRQPGWRLLTTECGNLMRSANAGVLGASNWEEVQTKRAFIDGLNAALSIPTIRLQQAEKTRRDNG